MSQSRNSHCSFLTFTEPEFLPRFFSLVKIQYHLSFAFSLFTGYQSQVEKRSSICTQKKLHNYIKKEDPNLIICYYDLDFGVSTSIWLIALYCVSLTSLYNSVLLEQNNFFCLATQRSFQAYSSFIQRVYVECLAYTAPVLGTRYTIGNKTKVPHLGTAVTKT